MDSKCKKRGGVEGSECRKRRAGGMPRAQKKGGKVGSEFKKSKRGGGQRVHMKEKGRGAAIAGKLGTRGSD